MRELYWKIIRGYNAEDYIEIEQKELEKALGAFLLKKDGVYSGGAVRGSEILAIQPDYHRTMLWNRGYKLGVDDFEELSGKGIDKKMRQIETATKEKIDYLIKSGQEKLIGKNIPITELDSLEERKQLNTEIKKISDDLSDKFQI